VSLEPDGSWLKHGISVVEDAALVIGMVQLGAVGTDTIASSKKNLGGGQHAECRRDEIDPKLLPVHGVKS
jgi:hypothetical protein